MKQENRRSLFHLFGTVTTDGGRFTQLEISVEAERKESATGCRKLLQPWQPPQGEAVTAPVASLRRPLSVSPDSRAQAFGDKKGCCFNCHGADHSFKHCPQSFVSMVAAALTPTSPQRRREIIIVGFAGAGGNIVCTHAGRTPLDSEGGRGCLQRRGAQCGCLRLAGLAENIFSARRRQEPGEQGAGRARRFFFSGVSRNGTAAMCTT